MNRLHVLVLLAAMACTGLVMGTVKAEAADSGKELRAAVNATAPPFAFMENGKLVGFEVDLHAEVAKRMGKQLVMTNIPFAGLAPGLQAKKWDAAGNTWINKERLVMMDFSDPWVDAQLAFVTRKNDAITSPEQLKGKTVGAEAGTAEQRWLDANQEKYGPYTIRTYDRSIDILMDLMNKRLDAYLREQTRALYQIKNYPMLGVAFPVGDVVRSGRGLPQGRSPARRIQHDPQQHEAGRTLAALYEKWLGTKPGPDSSTVHVYTTPCSRNNLFGAAFQRRPSRRRTQCRQRTHTRGRSGNGSGISVTDSCGGWWSPSSRPRGAFSHRREPRSASAAGLAWACICCSRPSP